MSKIVGRESIFVVRITIDICTYTNNISRGLEKGLKFLVFIIVSKNSNHYSNFSPLIFRKQLG